MLELPTESASLRRLSLVDAVTRRDPMAGAASVTEPARFSLSTPFITPLDETLVGGDPELAAFWASQKAAFAYDYVTFRCDFDPAQGEPIESAWIAVELVSPDATGAPAAVTWSMSPRIEADETKLTDSATLGADYKLLKAGVGSSEETSVKHWFVRARGEHQSRSYWEFQDNGISRIEGTFRLNMIVRRPVASPAVGRIDARITVSKRSFLILRRSEDRSLEGTSFRLPGGA